MQLIDKYGEPVTREVAIEQLGLRFTAGEEVERHALQALQEARALPDPSKLYLQAERYALRRWDRLIRNPKQKVRLQDRTKRVHQFIRDWYAQQGL